MRFNVLNSIPKFWLFDQNNLSKKKKDSRTSNNCDLIKFSFRLPKW